MTLLASENASSAIALIPEGVYVAVCYSVVDIGTHYSQMWEKDQHSVLITWEIPELRIDIERDGEKRNLPRAISREFTLSLGERANLRHTLEAWRGRKFTPEELKGFDLSALIGAGCQIQVTHAEKNGKTYANIGAIMALPKGMKVGKPENPTVVFCLKDCQPDCKMPAVPQWVQNKILSSKEWTELHPVDGELVTAAEPAPESTVIDDDIPF